MSPLAAILAQELSPWVVLPGLLVEWWAIWFTLGRNFTTTTLMTLAANGLSLLLSAVLLFSGVLGDPRRAEPAPGLGVLVASVAVALALALVVETLVLRRMMRVIRANWSWNTYDLMTFGAANALGMILAAWMAWRGGAVG